MKKIFLAEDDEYLRNGLCEMLSEKGYSVTAASSVKDSKAIILHKKFDLIILDVILSDGNGIDICKEARSSRIYTPILFLTACDEEIDIVRGLDAGGDDYVTKPFRLQELMSRIRALLRRNTDSTYRVSDIEIDCASMAVTKSGTPLFLTKTEYQILLMLAKNKGNIVTRTVLLESIWDDNGSFIDNNTLSVHISRLREKIGPEHIKTVRGIGYLWENE